MFRRLHVLVVIIVALSVIVLPLGCTQTAMADAENTVSHFEQYGRELAKVDALLAADQNAFNGYNKSSSLADIRAESDRMRRIWMQKEIMAAASEAQRLEIAARHKAYWKRVEANRAERESARSGPNLVHGLMRIYVNKKKAGL